MLPHPTDDASMLVAMSTGGVYRTTDCGATWSADNTGIKAYFLPDPWPEYGQCVHKVARTQPTETGSTRRITTASTAPTTAGTVWKSIADGLPTDFGFGIVAHPHRGDVIYTFPITADGDGSRRRTAAACSGPTDAGDTWEALTTGLPDGPYYGVVLRDAMCADDADSPASTSAPGPARSSPAATRATRWSRVAANLPDVLCVRAAAL